AFSYAVQDFVLNKHYFIGRLIMPSGDSSHLYRPLLYGAIDLSKDRAFYYVCLVFLALTMAAALSFRRNRSGRVLIAARDNQRAAPAYAINLARTRLAAFAVSGGIAGVAGVLFAYAQRDVVPGSYSVEASILVFLAAAIAGVSSVWWSVFGVMALEASVAFGPRLYDLTHSQTLESVLPLLLTGPLLLINQYFYPGGSAQSGYDRRDQWLRKLAGKHGIIVPSLVADVRVDQEAERDVIVEAERHVEAAAEGGGEADIPAGTPPGRGPRAGAPR
ncbi:MAG TPA: branched-chain amino acid ABC transporter permease, partial [Acidimicrobiales bacterium]|nr:branched-chain amino acid ABC transporter permease [Acidimicrobiales bacterium]